jgi:hypothetical protein
MNKFPYGYEDQLIRNIGSLERFEDYIFKGEDKDKPFEEAEETRYKPFCYIASE